MRIEFKEVQNYKVYTKQSCFCILIKNLKIKILNIKTQNKYIEQSIGVRSEIKMSYKILLGEIILFNMKHRFISGRKRREAHGWGIGKGNDIEAMHQPLVSP